MEESESQFAALWEARRYATIEGSVALDATVTARTAAMPLHDPTETGRHSSVEVPPLPKISLDRGRAALTESAPRVETAPTSADLQMLATLGEGGMGVVYLARQRSLSRDVAVKVLRQGHSGSEGDDLLREALITGGIEHPNIVPVHALGRDDEGRPVLVMKRIEGTNWRTLLLDETHPSWAPLLEAHGDRLTAHLEVLQRVAEAAHFAHTRGVVHRDIKPDNVMVGAFGEVYLVDWGVALRLGHVEASPDGSALRGTPAYMAPEMVAGDETKVDARTDVYLLGATLHEVLTGKPRHDQPNLHATLFAAFASKPVKYGEAVPEELAALCNEATHADATRRPPSAIAFRRRVADHLKHRASVTLSETAEARAESLREALAAAKPDDGVVRRLATEARYGFAQAVVVWPGNTAARDGLQRVLRRLFEHEIARENGDAARAIMTELDAPDAAMTEKLAALEEALRLRREREAMALQEVAERDLSRGAGARLGVVAALALGTTAAHVLLTLRSAGGVSLDRMVKQQAVVVALTFVAVGVWRERLLVNRITRQFVAVMFLNLVGTLAHRALLLGTDAGVSVPSVVLSDLAMMVAVNLAAAFGIGRWFGVPALCAALGVVLTVLDPSRAPRWFTLSANLMLVSGIYFGWFRVRAGGSADVPLGQSGTTRSV